MSIHQLIWHFLFCLLTGRWFLRSSGSSWMERWETFTAPHLRSCPEPCSRRSSRTQTASPVCVHVSTHTHLTPPRVSSWHLDVWCTHSYFQTARSGRLRVFLSFIFTLSHLSASLSFPDAKEAGTDNRNIVDDGKSQKLTRDDIEDLKEKGLEGQVQKSPCSYDHKWESIAVLPGVGSVDEGGILTIFYD